MIKLSRSLIFFCSMLSLYGLTFSSFASQYVFEAGHPSLQRWLLPEEVPAPDNNKTTPERVELGKKLFFDTRLSGDGNMSCATCHNPMFGWSDGLATAKGFKSMVLGRATPTIVNTGYNSIQMWDGRKATLEDQAMGPMESHVEMNMSIPRLVEFLKTSDYAKSFKKAYPDEPIGTETLAKALAAFERTVVSRNSPFDRWVKGEKDALTPAQINGFKVFVDPDKGNCEVCHSAPNFTDNGFHNIGLPSYGAETPDMGRFEFVPIRLMKGAFKTPTVRDITTTAPYFHDGSARTLEDVVDHYITGGVVKTNVSPNMKALTLTDKEKADLVAFLEALTSPQKPFTLPAIPL
ncbi:tryptophan tryptophylquinone biosynthesis enzyme MauG [Aestuariibacter sp. AA17]|uniref:Tryptophan tryptophylquinone biosynthesis enzyme MauG n=1 Tax=Fluctibacter corallii TaxID=2984329 RepID=A0ABT3AAJ6_9ALTE|nr:cytochrome c peroxidase [Aestuariibacter sp. AA17]MCV2885702.1 tryptophan tryptophylquinone biosynthesis enzyme MauG [Aestuariibacter sp. AA17]